MSEILSQFGITIISAKGKSRLADTLLQAPRNSLVVFDTCGIAGDFCRLLKIAERMGSQLFDSESLEWEIGHALFPNEFHDYEVPQNLAYASAEAYYISELTRLLEQYGIPYSKSNPGLTSVFHEGKGVVHSRFCDLSVCPGTHTDIYKELRELDETAR